MGALCVVLGLGGRVLLHRLDDLVRAQRIGSWTWTVLLVMSRVDIFGYITNPASECPTN